MRSNVPPSSPSSAAGFSSWSQSHHAASFSSMASQAPGSPVVSLQLSAPSAASPVATGPMPVFNIGAPPPLPPYREKSKSRTTSPQLFRPALGSASSSSQVPHVAAGTPPLAPAPAPAPVPAHLPLPPPVASAAPAPAPVPPQQPSSGGVFPLLSDPALQSEFEGTIHRFADVWRAQAQRVFEVETRNQQMQNEIVRLTTLQEEVNKNFVSEVEKQCHDATSDLRKRITSLEEDNKNLKKQLDIHKGVGDLSVLSDEEIKSLEAQLESSLSNVRKEHQNRQTCVVCLERPRRTLLMPCKHFCLCKECAASVSLCPMDRVAITDKIDILAP